MSDRDGYAPGVPNWITTMQPDPPAGEQFYSQLMGWDMEPAGGFSFATLRGRKVAAVAPLPPNVDPPPPPDWITSVQVASADETVEKTRAAGGRVRSEPFDGPTGRMAVIADPTGGTVAVWEPDGFRGAEVVNEFGAWAMSQLETEDPEAAAAFYGAVFGWTTETLGEGDDSITMFRLPGYVGGEPEQPVSREVVATMSRAPGGGRWVVGFWVRDVDATARNAHELGGSVIQPPFDMPIGRGALLADTAGVPFTVTRMAAVPD